MFAEVIMKPSNIILSEDFKFDKHRLNLTVIILRMI